MSLVALAAIGVAVFVASLVSGVFGIAGGMIMLGVLLIFFDVPTAMVLFSLLAATGNAWRVVSWWGHVNWRIMWGYAAGGLIATVLMGFVAFVPSKAMVYLILGLIPYRDRAIATRSSSEHRVARDAAAVRAGNDRDPARCRQWRPVARRILSEELA